jgi:hypothetical protein
MLQCADVPPSATIYNPAYSATIDRKPSVL